MQVTNVTDYSWWLVILIRLSPLALRLVQYSCKIETVGITVRVTTRAVYDIEGRLLEWEGFEYFGPVAECKKGRNNLQTAANQGNQDTSTAQGIEQQGQNIANSEISTNGQLSPLVSKQLANEKAQIGKTYATSAQAAGKGLAMRGMGAAPTGAASSLTNTAINNAGNAETGVVGNAFGEQNELNNTALTQPLNAVNTANEGIGAATNAGEAVNKAGSTLGDIASGLGTIVGLGTGMAGFGKAGGLGSIRKAF